MLYRFRRVDASLTQVSFTQVLEIELNPLARSVSVRREAYRTEVGPRATPPRAEVRSFETPERAAKYARYRVWLTLQEGDYWSLVAGDRSRLTEGEDFFSVKDRSRHYRLYLREGERWDVDRDGVELTQWEGPIDRAGARQVEVFDDEVAAEARWRALQSERSAAGWALSVDGPHPDIVEDVWRATLPRIYREFLEQRRWVTYAGRRLRSLPGRPLGEPFAVSFDDPGLDAAARTAGLSPEAAPQHVPIALGGDGAVLVIHAANPVAPVYLLAAGMPRLAIVDPTFKGLLARLRP